MTVTLLPAALFVAEYWELGSQPTFLEWKDTWCATVRVVGHAWESLSQACRSPFWTGWRDGREILLSSDERLQG